jgi:hypothetical protein
MPPGSLGGQAVFDRVEPSTRRWMSPSPAASMVASIHEVVPGHVPGAKASSSVVPRKAGAIDK